MKPHKIRSVFSDELLDPPQWTKEILDLEYSELDVISIIKTYELYIALIFRSLQHIHKINALYDWSINVIEESKDWINDHIKNTTFIEIYDFLVSFINDFNWGVYKDKENTKKCYLYINNLIRYCFYPDKKGETFNIGTYIKDYHKKYGLASNMDYHNEYKYAEGIKILYFNSNQFAEIKLLIDYYSRLKYNLQEKYNEKNKLKQIEKKGDIQSILPINWIEVIISNTFINDNPNICNLLNEIIKDNEDIKNMIDGLGKENTDKLKELLLNLFDTNKDIKKLLIEIIEIKEKYDYKLHYNRPIKLLFLHDFSCFKDTLEILIEKKYVINDESSDTFKWRYRENKTTKKGKPKKQHGMILLAFLFLDFYYIQKLIDENKINKEKNKDIDYFEHGEIFFNAVNCKLINKAFNLINIENCKADKAKKIPRDYVELINDLGILKKSNIASTQKK